VRPVVLPEWLTDGRHYRAPRSIPAMPGWLHIGPVAAYVGVEKASAIVDEVSSEAAQALTTVLSGHRSPAAEDPSKERVAFRPGEKDTRKDCDECKGTGECTCHCRDVHDCGGCDGDGKLGPAPLDLIPGERWYRSGEESILLADSLAHLLGGLTAFAVEVPGLKPVPFDGRAILGVDADGDAVVLIAPMRPPS